MAMRVLATSYNLWVQRMNTTSCKVLQNKQIVEIDDRALYFVTLVIRHERQHQIPTGRVDDTEKANVIEELPQRKQ